MSKKADRSLLFRNVVIGLAVVGTISILFWLWSRGRTAPEGPSSPLPLTAAETAGPQAAGSAGAETAKSAAEGDRTRQWTELIGAPPRWPQDFGTPQSCDEVRHDLEQVCAALDERVPELAAQGGACTLVAELGAELASRPPELASELRSYDTLLRNVFHLFRVVGRERMQAARSALAQEELAEPTAFAFYRWAVSDARCSRSGKGVVKRETLYAYAGFLFHTLGGQAYLRRRSPKLESLACFYGLHALDGAIRSGTNPQGLDPRPEIERCRDLIAAQDFVFTEQYLAELEAMAGRWQAKGQARP